MVSISRDIKFADQILISMNTKGKPGTKYPSIYFKSNIYVSYRYYLNQHCIMVLLDSEVPIAENLFEGLEYSQTEAKYYIPYTKITLNKLLKYYLNKGFSVDYRGFTRDLNKQIDFLKKLKRNKIRKVELPELTKSDEEKIEKFKVYLTQLRYGESTIKTYINALGVFLAYSTSKTEQIHSDDLITFNHDYIIGNGYSTSYQNQVINAIKLYFDRFENISIDIDSIERPRKSYKLPKVIAKEHVEILLKGIKNQKHKLALTLIYALGLRAGELISMKLTDLSSKSMTATIRQGKGAKDRMVPISLKLMEMIKNYYHVYKPLNYLIEGQTKGEPYSIRSLELVFHREADRALGPNQHTLHSLRHSFATHNLEAGVDIRYIQELLGHKSSKTTEIYTQVSIRNLKNIKTLTDDFDL